MNSATTLDGLGRLHQIQSVATSGNVILHRTTYGYDSLHRRTVASEHDGRKWGYGYNTRNEVTSPVKKRSDSGT